MKTCLVTGAYGLVGSTICRILKEQYPDLDVSKVKLDNVPKGQYDYIIHAAGYGQPQMFGKDKAKTIEINTELTDWLLRTHLKKTGSFMFISSSEVYSGVQGPHSEDMIGTTSPQHPRACYIEGKRCGEAICMAYKEQGYDVKIARLALAYGPGTKKGDTRVLNQFIEQALTMGRILLMDKGEAERTYCYVGDAAEMILDILFKGKDVVYNVGGLSEVTIANLAALIATMTGVDFILGNKSLEGSPPDVRLDLRKTLREFPRDFVSLYDGLNNTIEYQKHLYGKN